MLDDYGDHLVDEVRAGHLSRRDLIRRGTAMGLSFTAIGTLLSACGADPNKKSGSAAAPGTPATKVGAYREGGTMRIGNTVPAGNLEPLTMNDGGTVGVVMMACEYLCFPAQDLTLEPRLATEWKPGATAKEWTFTLRDNVLWQDGSKLSADDVVASFKRYTDPKGIASALASFAGILVPDGVEKAGPLSVKFHLERPYADFPYLVSALNYATPILPANYQEGDFRKGGVGTGAFTLTKYAPKQSATFEAHPKYWGGTPHVDGAKVTFYAETAAMVLAMQGGSLDFIPGFSYRDAQTLKGTSDVTLFTNPSSSYRPIHMRVDTKPFDDKRVRQAIALGVDREALANTLLGGTAQIGNDHAFAPIFPSSPPEGTVPQRTRDVDAAKRLLADAGHGNGLQVTLTGVQFQDIPQLAVLLKQQLKEIGADLKLDIMTEAAFFGSGNNQPWLEVPFGIVYWASRGTPSQLIQPAYLKKSPWNSAHWKDAEFDTLMAKFDAEADESTRQKLGVQAATLMHDEVPAVIPYWLPELRAVRKGVQGVAPGPNVVLDPSKIGFAA
jgi:peptide/nickel transport system substrate-binding protein